MRFNVVVPMAGKGSRFSEAGHLVPKPMIPVRGVPMIRRVVDSFGMDKHTWTFLVGPAVMHDPKATALLGDLRPGCLIREVGPTQGAASTVLMASDQIDDDAPLIILNCDNLISWKPLDLQLLFTSDPTMGGAILTFQSTSPGYSYVQLGADGFVCRVAEKKVISSHATAGAYAWRHGRDFVRYARRMIQRDVRTNGEFYVAPAYNEAICDGLRVAVLPAGMVSLGTPEDVKAYEEVPSEPPTHFLTDVMIMPEGRDLESWRERNEAIAETLKLNGELVAEQAKVIRLRTLLSDICDLSTMVAHDTGLVANIVRACRSILEIT